VLLMVSGGVAAPAAAVKALAKVGARVIMRMVKKLRTDVLKVNRRKVGVRLSVECLGGFVPYPSLGVYT
jgi:hypothetical protein